MFLIIILILLFYFVNAFDENLIIRTKRQWIVDRGYNNTVLLVDENPIVLKNWERRYVNRMKRRYEKNALATVELNVDDTIVAYMRWLRQKNVDRYGRSRRGYVLPDANESPVVWRRYERNRIHSLQRRITKDRMATLALQPTLVELDRIRMRRKRRRNNRLYPFDAMPMILRQFERNQILRLRKRHEQNVRATNKLQLTIAELNLVRNRRAKRNTISVEPIVLRPYEQRYIVRMRTRYMKDSIATNELQLSINEIIYMRFQRYHRIEKHPHKSNMLDPGETPLVLRKWERRQVTQQRDQYTQNALQTQNLNLSPHEENIIRFQRWERLQKSQNQVQMIFHLPNEHPIVLLPWEQTYIVNTVRK